MAGELNLLVWVHVFVVVMKFGTFLAIREPQVPCYFIFGDSLVDNGNSNRLETTYKANYPPYGIDFPQGVTGRFTNGRTFADIIGELLGFDKFIPPYATVTNEQISKGVNYGSGGAGIREESGIQLGDRISFDRQLLNHKTITSRLLSSQRNTTLTREYLAKCIYVVNMGNNDYINNYFMPNVYITSHIYTTEQYASALVQKYFQQLTTLYNLGGRKIAVFGLGPIGCTPALIAKFGTKGKPCVESINDAIKLFNDKLKPLVEELNVRNPNARFTFINFTRITTPRGDVSVPNVPCCQVRDGLCIPNTIPCQNRNLPIFYDGLHPTDTTNDVFVTRSYTASSPVDVYPYNISHLAQL